MTSIPTNNQTTKKKRSRRTVNKPQLAPDRKTADAEHNPFDPAMRDAEPEPSSKYDRQTVEAKPATDATAAAPDPFDPESLRISDTTSFGVEKVLTDVPCDKPNPHVFVRAHPDETYRLDTGLFFDKTQRNEAYIVAPNLRDTLAGDVVAVRLLTGITRHGDVFLWPTRLPGPDGRSNRWHESMASAAELAIESWVRVTSNMLAGRYDVARATGNLPDPEWPEQTFRELLKLSFQNRLIDAHDHPVLKSLRGEV